MALRLKLSKFKIALDFSQKQLLKMLLDYLTTWEKLLGNNRNDRILLNDFYVKILDLWPHEPYDNPIVRTRSVVASMQLGNDAMLADVGRIAPERRTVELRCFTRSYEKMPTENSICVSSLGPSRSHLEVFCRPRGGGTAELTGEFRSPHLVVPNG